MADEATDMTTFIETLTHRRRDDINALRRIVQSSHSGLTESVKWNAPSFAVAGVHRITFRLQPGDRVEIVFHRGSKPRTDAFEFTDRSGMIRWSTHDRGVVEFVDSGTIQARAESLRDLVREWIVATT